MFREESDKLLEYVLSKKSSIGQFGSVIEIDTFINIVTGEKYPRYL